MTLILPQLYMPSRVSGPQYIGSFTFTSVAGDLSETFSVAGAASGDLLVIALSALDGRDGAFSWTGISFTEIRNDMAAERPNGYLGYAVWDGSTTGITTSDVTSFRWDYVAGVVAVFRGADTFVANAHAASSTTIPPNGPSVSGTGVLHVAATHVGIASGGGVSLDSEPSGWSLAAIVDSVTGGSSGTVGLAYNFDGLNDPGDWGATGSSGMSHTNNTSVFS